MTYNHDELRANVEYIGIRWMTEDEQYERSETRAAPLLTGTMKMIAHPLTLRIQSNLTEHVASG